MPRDKQLDAIREALRLNETAPSFEYLGSPNQVMQHLFNLAKAMFTTPAVVGKKPVLRTNGNVFEYALIELDEQIESCKGLGISTTRERIDHWIATLDLDELNSKARKSGRLTASVLSVNAINA